MFASTYFPPDYFPKTYFPSGGVSAPSTGGYFPQTYFEATYFTPFYFPGSGITITPIVYADIWEALVAYVDAMVPEVLGGIHADRAPDAEYDGTPKVFPFAVYSSSPGGQDLYDASVKSYSDGDFTITTYSIGSRTQAHALSTSIRETVQDAPLVFSGGTLLYLRSKGRDNTTIDPDIGPGGQDVYQSTVMFRYIIERDT